MRKTEFLEKISKCSREEIDRILHEKCKPVKLIPVMIRLKKMEEEKC